MRTKDVCRKFGCSGVHAHAPLRNRDPKRQMKADPLRPSASLLCKLGSIIVHAEESMSPDGHPFDLIELHSLFNDAEVSGWMAEMRRLAMLPVKRRGNRNGND